MGAPTWIRVWVVVAACGALLTVGCDGGTLGKGEEPLVDSDGDGLYDSFEVQIGTDPILADSDEDGHLDGDEWYLFCDPQNADDHEYVDGNGNVVWDHFPYPADLDVTGEGNQFGDVVANFSLPDYWVQDVNLYSFYGHVIEIEATADT